MKFELYSDKPNEELDTFPQLQIQSPENSIETTEGFKRETEINTPLILLQDQ